MKQQILSIWDAIKANVLPFIKQFYCKLPGSTFTRKAIACTLIINSPLLILSSALYLRSKLTNKKRIHYVEIHDLNICPSFIRDWGTNVIKLNYSMQLAQNGKKTTVIKECIPYITDILDKCNATILLDLCSGAGGPCPVIQRHLNDQNDTHKDVKLISVIMSDLYPAVKNWEDLCKEIENLSFIQQPMNALNIFKNEQKLVNKNKVRSMFGSMHHFTQDQVQQILSDVIEENDGFFALELFNNDFIEYLVTSIMLFFPINPLIRTFQMKPFPWKAFILFPVCSWIWMHDAYVSFARLHKKEQWLELANKCSQNKEKNYQWNVYTLSLIKNIVTINIYTGYPLE